MYDTLLDCGGCSYNILSVAVSVGGVLVVCGSCVLPGRWFVLRVRHRGGGEDLCEGMEQVLENGLQQVNRAQLMIL